MGLLQEVGVRVPRYRVIKTAEEALELASSHGNYLSK